MTIPLLAARADPDARLTDAAGMRPLVQAPPRDAQPGCNFIVFTPTALPRGCAIAASTLRPEQPPGRPDGVEVAAFGQTPWSIANPCSLRTEIRGPGRALRLKQFLYDWAPSAAGVASLWDSPDWTPFPCQGVLGWLGTDYHEQPGACVCLARTTVELCVLEGRFAPAELRAVLAGLTVADPAAAARIDAQPFHALNYWVHYRLAPYRVPYGLWAWPHRRPYDQGRRIEPAQLAGLAGVRPLLPPPGGPAVESLLHVEDAEADRHEVEIIARDEAGLVWMTGLNADCPAAPAIPPTPEDHPAAVRKAVTARGGQVWLAALTADHGPWEAFWEEAGFRYAAWFPASPRWDEAGVLSFLEGLAPATFPATSSSG